jgi:hypothetical protein
MIITLVSGTTGDKYLAEADNFPEVDSSWRWVLVLTSPSPKELGANGNPSLVVSLLKPDGPFKNLVGTRGFTFPYECLESDAGIEDIWDKAAHAAQDIYDGVTS